MGLARDRRGSVTLLAAAGLMVAMAGGALAVDLGSVFYESRRLQGVADAAALSAAYDLGGANAAASRAVTLAGWRRTITPAVVTGTWSLDPATAPARRFTPGGSAPNAARVTLQMETPLFFARAFGRRTVRIGRTATAARIDLASFSLGSRLAALDGGVANQLLGGLIGTSVSLTAADYQALVGADVDLLALTGALRTELALSGGSFTQTLAAQTTLPHVLTALSAALRQSGQGAAATAAGKLAQTSGTASIALGSLLDLGPLGQQDRAGPGQSLAVNAFDLVRMLAEQASGARQAALDVTTGVPGLLTTTAKLAVGERAANSPWLAVASGGQTIVRTAQSRLYLEGRIGGSPALKLLGINEVRLPLYVELAGAEAKLSRIACTAGERSATIDVRPSIGHASLAEVSASAFPVMSATPVESPAVLLDLGGYKATLSARADLGDGAWQTVPFSGADIAARATRTVGSSGIVGGLAASLLSKTSVSVTYGRFSSPSPTTAALITPLLTLLAPALDSLLSGLLDLLGVHLGQADVRLNGLRCGSAALVA